MRSQLAEEFFMYGKSESCPVYEMHGHMGRMYAIYLSNTDSHATVRAMDRAGVKMFVFTHHAALLSPELGNSPSISAVREYPDRMRAYCAINPNCPSRVAADIAEFDNNRDVFIGFKMLGDYHRVSLHSPAYSPAWEKADRDELPVLCHTWSGSPYDGFECVTKVAEKYPNARIIVGHSLHQEWDNAITLGKRFPNVYLELCAVLDDSPGVLERFVGEVGSERVLFGTDFPWFDYHYYIGAILGADITDEDRHNILHRNAERLIGPTSYP